jgi:hypothetical protein
MIALLGNRKIRKMTHDKNKAPGVVAKDTKNTVSEKARISL